ncbi:methyltransferase domain-containing protein [bacterium]|nr:methyltransferase domain-containing protein [bacterium]
MTGDLFGQAAAAKPSEPAPTPAQGPKSGTYLAEVRDQYEDLPYPPFDPEWDKFRFFCPINAQFDAITHFGFSGKRDLRQGKTRVLIAGGGTGSTTMALAEQLRDNPEAEVVYLDMSSASMRVAKQRAEIRGLTNITWIHDSLLNIPSLGIGKFDFIDCAGVLHHLASPDDGLKALVSALDEDGVISIMLYGYYGRMSIYLMQELFRHVNQGVTDKQQKIENVKKILRGGLPSSNPFTRDYKRFEGDLAADGGIYDLLLHTQDRAYTIPQLYDYVEGAGLTLNKLFTFNREMGAVSLDPALYIKDMDLLAHVMKLPLREQQAISEIIMADGHKQECYASFKERPLPNWEEDMDMVPSLSMIFDLRAYESLAGLMDKANVGQYIELRTPNQKWVAHVQRTSMMHLICRYFDGERSVKEIFRKVMETPEGEKNKANFVTLKEEFRQLYNALAPLQWIYLRKSGIPRFKGHNEILQPYVEKYPGALEAYLEKERARRGGGKLPEFAPPE